ncbi:hypothetical protein ACERK3_19145 [Phycisphaerales bacterium AB-hyl4]|uniref:NUMOD1 domain-containing protein n=1 Tax=Natronomicrosphaera hydrolytica TaxID=3242702 RepID=A0ABV4U9V1_9BACT
MPPTEAPKSCKVPVEQIGEDGQVVGWYPSIVEASEAMGLQGKGIGQAIAKGYRAAGYHWRKATSPPAEPLPEAPPPPHPHTTRPGYITQVEKLDDEGNVVGRFESLAQASRETNVPKQCIANAVHRGHRTAGYHWRRIGPVKHPRRGGESGDE